MYKRFLAVLGLYFMCMSVEGLCEQKVTYESKTAGKIKQVEWSIVDEQEGFIVNGKAAGSKVAMTFAPDFSFIQYEEESVQKKDFRITRKGSSLLLIGTSQGKKIEKSYVIGEDNWVQDFNFGLRPLLQSEKSSFTFHIISPKDFAMYELIATKEGQETVIIGEKEYLTERVKVTLTGFKKRFWKGLMWFDKNNHLLVRYKANEGPGTPYTETTLLQAE